MGKRLILILATSFGLGLSPLAPGTVGIVPGVFIALAASPLNWMWQAALALALAAAAVPICGVAEKHFGNKDDRRIVADEYLTFPLSVVGINLLAEPWLLPVAIVTHRLMDIVKIPPAWQAQKLRGGLGVALDDVVSSLYALALNHLARLVANRMIGA